MGLKPRARKVKKREMREISFLTSKPNNQRREMYFESDIERDHYWKFAKKAQQRSW